MTTPYERTRALRQAWEILERLVKREDVPADVRKQAQAVLTNRSNGHWTSWLRI
jgi:uncharacterized protein (UPF0147 family)